MTLIPDFIKKLTLSTSVDVFAFSGRGGSFYQTSTASKVVNAGTLPPQEGYVVLSQVSKGVKSIDDSYQAPTLRLGSIASVLVVELEPLVIGVGTGATDVVESENIVIPRFTRFTSNARWG